MTYVAWVSTEGGGPPSGGLTWYFGEYAAGGSMPSGSNAATTARDDFVANLAETVTWEDWEGEGPWGPWESAMDLTGVEITRNGVTADIVGTAFATLTTDNNGRFNVDPPLPPSLFCETIISDALGPSQFQMNFTPAIVAWGAFLTDLGDFFDAPISIEITKSGGGTETYELTTGGASNGMLTFIGFVDDSGTTTYTSIRIYASGTEESNTDGVGLDDIYWCAADGLA